VLRAAHARWQPDVRDELLHNEVISKLIEVLKTVQRKKIVRITFSVLRVRAPPLYSPLRCASRLTIGRAESAQRAQLQRGHDCLRPAQAADVVRWHRARLRVGGGRVTSSRACGCRIAGRKWADDDLTADIQVVDEVLQKYVVTLSSFEKYHAELMSGHLVRSACARSLSTAGWVS
jgi:hypothetical protein